MEDDEDVEEAREVYSYNDKSDRKIIYNMYLKLSQFEHHFDTITTKYKYLALTWLLAAYAGIGFLLSRDIQGLPFSPLIAVIIACIIGICGITLLWHLDVNIYTKFWAVVFIEAVRMERKFKFLLQSRNIEFLIDEDRERIVSQSLLYMIANILLLLTIGVVLIYFFMDKNLFFFLGLGVLFTFLAFFICGMMYKVAKNSQRRFVKAIKQMKI